MEGLKYFKDVTVPCVMTHGVHERLTDEMAKVLADYKYEELICIEVDCEHIELQNGGKCIGDKNCIKEYFKKKVEGK